LAVSFTVELSSEPTICPLRISSDTVGPTTREGRTLKVVHDPPRLSPTSRPTLGPAGSGMRQAPAIRPNDSNNPTARAVLRGRHHMRRS
jgi:hypothetical protein